MGYIKTQLVSTKFITLVTCFGCCGPSSGHKSTRKTICSVQKVLVHGLELYNMFILNWSLAFKCLTVYTWSVRKVSDLWPRKRNWLTWSVGHLITLKVVPLGLHTLLPAVPPLLEACRKSLFRNGV